MKVGCKSGNTGTFLGKINDAMFLVREEQRLEFLNPLRLKVCVESIHCLRRITKCEQLISQWYFSHLPKVAHYSKFDIQTFPV